MTGEELHDAITTLRWSREEAAKVMRLEDVAILHAWVRGERKIPDWAASQMRWELAQKGHSNVCR